MVKSGKKSNIKICPTLALLVSGSDHTRKDAVLRTIRPEGSDEYRMYVVVRADLPAGYQMAQAVHAAVHEGIHNEVAVHKYPTVVVLSVRDESHLFEMVPEDATIFREPDLEWNATAFSTFSDGTGFEMLPLALKRGWRVRRAFSKVVWWR